MMLGVTVTTLAAAVPVTWYTCDKALEDVKVSDEVVVSAAELDTAKDTVNGVVGGGALVMVTASVARLWPTYTNVGNVQVMLSMVRTTMTAFDCRAVLYSPDTDVIDTNDATVTEPAATPVKDTVAVEDELESVTVVVAQVREDGCVSVKVTTSVETVGREASEKVTVPLPAIGTYSVYVVTVTSF